MKRALIGVLTFGLAPWAFAGSRDQAKRLHDRLAGVPPSPEVLDEMASLIEDGRALEAAQIPLESEFFYRITLRNMISRWTNVDEKVDVPLNDYTATVIGLVRDNEPFDQVLYGNIIYTGPDNLQAATPYDPASNAHYEAFENQDLSYKDSLTRRVQTEVTGLPVAAGVLTTRAFGDAYYNMGTNRRAIRFTMMTFLCRDMEQLMDLNLSDAYVRRDVDRAPGGDPLTYRGQCVGCHSGMDPLSKAFAYFDFVNGAITYTPNQVPEKINRGASTFPAGYVTQDDEWRNLWSTGPNAALGWKGPMSGNGPESFGRMIAASDAFGQCMAERVFTKVCLRSPADSEDSELKRLAKDFRDSNYDMKGLFAGAAVLCMGE